MIVKVIPDQAIVTASTVDESIEKTRMLDKRDFIEQSWDIKVLPDRIFTRLEGYKKINRTGVSTLLGRINVPRLFADRIPGTISRKLVNDLLFEKKDTKYTIRLLSDSVRAVLSDKYGILDHIKILQILKKLGVNSINYNEYPTMCMIFLTDNVTEVALDSHYNVRIVPTILNSETSEKSFIATVSACVLRDNDIQIGRIIIRNHRQVMNRIIHRGKIEERTEIAIENLIRTSADRIRIVENKVQSLVNDDSEDITQYVWEDIKKEIRQQIPNTSLTDEELGNPNSNLEIFLKVCSFLGKINISRSGKDFLENLLERLLW